ncbi:MAG TPA: MBL fold metallo-hydrolase [Acidimicrobiales bacterium]|nr:MBL fold metallo-hydrolase [Acidimicrobiales bacterium]
MVDRLYFHQLLSGRDFARDDPVAAQMVNFVYLIGDRQTGEAIAVDPAYGIAELLGILAADGMRLTGVLATHHHPDHVGGSMMGYSIQGIRDLLDVQDVPVHVNSAEAEWVRRGTAVSSTDLVSHESGDVLDVGAIPIQLLHTPGHTPGSQCFLVDSMLVSGDTLFLEGCGRTDLPGSDADAMYESLQKLASLPDETAVFPGHRYSAPSVGTIAAVKEINYVFKPKSKDAWLTMFGMA